jgi:hypothetical protein
MKFGEIALYVMLTAGGAFRVSASWQRAVRSRYVPLYLPIATELLAGFRIFPAICNLQGDFRNCRESRSYRLSNVLIISRLWKEFSRLKEQGEFLGIAGKVLGIAGKILGIAGRRAALELRMVAGFGGG